MTRERGWAAALSSEAAARRRPESEAKSARSGAPAGKAESRGRLGWTGSVEERRRKKTTAYTSYLLGSSTVCTRDRGERREEVGQRRVVGRGERKRKREGVWRLRRRGRLW